ncbi:MAG: efflux RND transporter permease subunit [Candidatus Moranbacteria bacterium]|nr:efflux RND transporter permease subunit [Candidatus Moranbacteria bacterium]MDD3965093.1 efflux RND transporter permease subunit [Candidatus Moranbacteria bacterium]
MSQNNPPEKLGLAGKITQIFLKNTELSILSIILLAVWGALSFSLMPKQYNPEIVAPAFTITTDFPGASASEIYELITRPIEDKVFELSDIDEVSSQSFPGGKSVVMVKFFVGSNREDAKITLNQKLRDNITTKPQGVSDPMIQSIDPDDVPILDIGLSSETFSPSSLRKLAIDISDTLKLTNGVSKVEIKGGYINHLEITIDGAKLSALDLTLDEVLGSLSQANDIYTFDTLETDERHSIVNIIGNIQNEESLNQIIVRNNGQTIVRISDIADVSYGPGEITHYVSRTEKDAENSPIVHIALSKLRGTNSTVVSEASLDTLDNLKGKLIPNDVRVDVLNDEGAIASGEISKLTFDLIKSIIIVGILLFIFLGAKNSLIATISIPLVLLAVFGTGFLAGQTINRITLFALILSLGLLVDDAIVVVENIARYFRLYPNENKLKLIVRAVDEVGGALALSTFTMAIAFIPMAFVTGMMGPYMGPIPFFVPVALIASLLFAVTINPFLALLFSKEKDKKQTNKTRSYESGIFFRIVKKIEGIYAEFLSRLLRERKRRNVFLGGVLILLIISLILPLTPLVPFRLLPKANKDQFSLYVDLPSGTHIEHTRKITEKIEKIILEESEITSVESAIGESLVVDFNGLFKGSSGRKGSNQATLKIHLTPHKDRSLVSEEIASSIRASLSLFTKGNPDAVIRLVEDPPGPPVLATFLLKIKGGDDRMREQIASDMTTEIRSISGIVDIDTSVLERGANISYRVNHEKAGLLGIAPNDIVRTLHTALSGSSIGLYHESSREDVRKAEQEYITIRFDKKSRDNENDLSLIRLMSKNGVTIPLTELIEKTEETVDTAILSDDREQTIYLSGEMEGRSIIYAVIDLFPKLLSYEIPGTSLKRVSWSLLGAVYEDTVTHKHYTIEIGGEWKLTLEVFRDLGIAMGLALFLIYFILAAKTESLFIPLLIMVSIPLALIGVLPGFALLQSFKGTYFNATSMIGVIALAGLAVKNAVIYLEYLEPLKKSGKKIEEALVETGRVRLLPIALTSLAAILGSFTIVSDPVWEGLGWSIIFGLTASTFLTLIVFPLVYFIFARKKWYNETKEE